MTDQRPVPLRPIVTPSYKRVLALFEADLNTDDPVRRQVAQLANLCVQVFSEYATLMQEADQELPRAARDRIIPVHMERSLEGLSRFAEILDIDLSEARARLDVSAHPDGAGAALCARLSGGPFASRTTCWSAP